MLSRNFLLALLATVAAISLSAQVANGKLQIHHIDMGQGDAAVLISPDGKVVLFDAGKDMANRKDCNVETEYLDQLGVKQIDYIFISHYHSDHIGCIPAVLKQFPLKGPAYDRGQDYSSAFYTNYVAAVGHARATATLGQSITLDTGADPVTLKVVSINGTFAGGSVPTQNENDLSVSVLVSFDGFREEIGGDLSGENTSSYQDIETGVEPSVGAIDVYKVHHHCSAYSSNESWLNETQPTVAIISDGDGNSYGHPAASCLERLHSSNVKKVYWTEKGAGTLGANDVLAGDVSIEVAPHATSYTVSYGADSQTDTYPMRASSGAVVNDGSDVSNPTERLYAWSAKGRLYYFVDCAGAQRISKANLRTGSVPPAGYIPAACVTEEPK